MNYNKPFVFNRYTGQDLYKYLNQKELKFCYILLRKVQGTSHLKYQRQNWTKKSSFCK